MTTAQQPIRERAARWGLWLLLLALPVAYAPRACRTVPEPQPVDPAWVHLLVVTATVWPELGRGLEPPALRDLDRRATRASGAWTAAVEAGPAAASLWTGRWPVNHGVLHDGLALAEGSWTLASSAAGTGAASAAFLQEPLATCQALPGFALVVEDPGATPAELGERAAAFLRAEAGRRRVVWVHLAHAGPGGEGVGAVLAALHGALEERADRFDALTVVTGFATESQGDTSFRVPLWVELPAGLFAGRRGGGNVSLVDLAGLIAQVARLDLPSASAGQARLQSRTDEIGRVLKGGGGEPWILVQGRAGDLLRFGRTCVRAPDRDAWRPEELEVQRIVQRPGGAEDLVPIVGPGVVAPAKQYRASLGEALAGATPARPSGCP